MAFTTHDTSASAVNLVNIIGDSSAAQVLTHSNTEGLTFSFNLGQFNVDASMDLVPTFLDLATVDISDAHYMVRISWYADVN